MDKKSFVLYTDYWDHIELLEDEQCGVLFKALIMHAAGNDLPNMDGITTMAFSFIKKQMDRDREKYEETLKKRREAGKMGGRPRLDDPKDKAKKANGSDNKAKKANGLSEKQSKAKKPDNDTVNVTVTVTDNVTDTVINNTSPEAEESAPNTIISIELNDGTIYDVSDLDYEYYVQLYPAIDVMQELRKMAGWCFSNPKNRKTRRGIKKFINGWLSRAQDKAPVKQGVSGGKQGTQEFYDDMKEWANERTGVRDNSISN